MSLVNDMLRDLDARRRDAPGTGSGPAKLIPASDGESSSYRGSSNAVKVVIAVAVGAVLAMVAVLGVVLLRDEPVQTVAVMPEPVQPQPVVENTVQRQAPAVDAAAIELQRLTERLQRLEEQNRALLAQESQGTTTVSQATVVPDLLPEQTQAYSEPQETTQEEIAQADPSTIASPTNSTPTNSSSVAEQSSALQSASTPAISTEQPALTEAPVSEPAVVRSPTELSFRDRDRQQVQQALSMWQQNQRGAALNALRQFSQENIEAHQSRETLAKLLLQQGDSIEALNLVDAGLQIAPDYNGYKKVKARILMAAGVSNDAADLLSVRAPTIASDSEYHELHAASLLASKQFDEALAVYEGLNTYSPEQARWWYGRAASLDALGRSFEAAQAYEQAIRLGGLSANLRRLSQERINAIRQN
ncbi:MAG: hypothetical protein R3332_10050 [Pseudohongiellaceae bacterium]|nr:hypothetical protein [Pseudohongiellaceae bacterium]